MHNLLTDPLIRFTSHDGDTRKVSLPEIFAALIRDDVASFPALRPHQTPSWHMFLAQLGALAMERAGLKDLPIDAESWRTAIRTLTATDFSEDEPWQLVVEDRQKPAFMQTPEPEGGGKYTGLATTPDALDMLVTSKNHDLKQSVAEEANLDDWLFALISLQTSEGYNGSGNNGIARMNGGSSSRVCLGLVPISEGSIQDMSGSVGTGVSLGKRLQWDIEKLLQDRAALLKQFSSIGYPQSGGFALLWTAPWPEGEQLPFNELDIWFIEICRNVRLQQGLAQLEAETGTTKAPRIAAKHLNGVVGDPWAPVNIKDLKTLTIGEQEFNYRLLSRLLFGEENKQDWQLPPMCTLSRTENKQAQNWLLIAQAIGRGNSKTYGYRERLVPITLKAALALGGTTEREQLSEISKKQIDEISKFKKALAVAIALFVEGGDRGEVGKESYDHARAYQDRLDQRADELFFSSLWQRYEAAAIEGDGHKAEDAARHDFLTALHEASKNLLEEALGGLPCRAIYRYRARVKAENLFNGMIRSEKSGFPALFQNSQNEDEKHDAA